MYYGIRSGHRPFNAPKKFRGKTAAGEVGEMVAEVDENIGHLMAQLEKYKIDQDTIMVFMSDNGADQETFKSNLLLLVGIFEIFNYYLNPQAVGIRNF